MNNAGRMSIVHVMNVTSNQKRKIQSGWHIIINFSISDLQHIRPHRFNQHIPWELHTIELQANGVSYLGYTFELAAIVSVTHQSMLHV